MRRQVASTVLSAALRSRALSLAKTCSIGFRSVSLLKTSFRRNPPVVPCGFRKPHSSRTRPYLWCNPPNTGRATILPTASRGREFGESLPSARWVRSLL